MYRGEHYIKTLFPTVTELTVLLFAGIKLVAPETPVPADIDEADHGDGADARASTSSRCSSKGCGWW